MSLYTGCIVDMFRRMDTAMGSMHTWQRKYHEHTRCTCASAHATCALARAHSCAPSSRVKHSPPPSASGSRLTATTTTSRGKWPQSRAHSLLFTQHVFALDVIKKEALNPRFKKKK